MRFQVLAVLFCFFAATNLHAETRYVSDELVITVRTGPSTQNQIIENLTSGDAVEVLEDVPDEGYTRVRVVADGTEGWVITRYLTDAPIAADRLVNAERDLAVARRRITELEANVGNLEGELTSTRDTLESTQSTNSEISDELADIRSASANAIALRDQNETFRRRVNDLSAEVEQLQIANAELRGRNRQNWFVVGAAVLLGGVIIGLVAPSLRPRRKTSW